MLLALKLRPRPGQPAPLAVYHQTTSFRFKVVRIQLFKRNSQPAKKQNSK